MKSTITELLAPAGNWEALEAAINAGADAVYFGGAAFGARQYANNFNREEIEKAVFFAHLHRVRLYVTVNTLVDDSEMEELADYLVFLSTLGVAGLIVQHFVIIEVKQKNKVVPSCKKAIEKTSSLLFPLLLNNLFCESQKELLLFISKQNLSASNKLFATKPSEHKHKIDNIWIVFMMILFMIFNLG